MTDAEMDAIEQREIIRLRAVFASADPDEWLAMCNAYCHEEFDVQRCTDAEITFGICSHAESFLIADCPPEWATIFATSPYSWTERYPARTWPTAAIAALRRVVDHIASLVKDDGSGLGC